MKIPLLPRSKSANSSANGKVCQGPSPKKGTLSALSALSKSHSSHSSDEEDLGISRQFSGGTTSVSDRELHLGSSEEEEVVLCSSPLLLSPLGDSDTLLRRPASAEDEFSTERTPSAGGHRRPLSPMSARNAELRRKIYRLTTDARTATIDPLWGRHIPRTRSPRRNFHRSMEDHFADLHIGTLPALGQPIPIDKHDFIWKSVWRHAYVPKAPFHTETTNRVVYTPQMRIHPAKPFRPKDTLTIGEKHAPFERTTVSKDSYRNFEVRLEPSFQCPARKALARISKARSRDGHLYFKHHALF